MEGLPFDESWGVIPNEGGRVTEPADRATRAGDVRQRLDQAWADRSDRNEQERRDGDRGRNAGRRRVVLRPRIRQHPDPSAFDVLVRARQPHLVNYEDWSRLDALEQSRGEAGGRPRVKFTSRAEMRAALTD